MQQDPVDNIEVCDERNGRGRPSINQQIEIEEKIWKYFADGISAPTAAKELGIDVKTAQKYYRQFAELRISETEDEFIEQCKINVESAVCVLDNLILRERKLLETLETELASQKNRTPKEEYQLRRELRETVKSIAQLVTLKTNLANSPTADIKLNRLIREMMDKFVA